MTLTKQTQDGAALDPSRYSQEVVDFCTKNGLLDKLDLAVEHLKQTFPEAQSVTVTLEQDPESNDRWIMVDALLQGPANQVRLRHQACVRQLLKLLPWPASTLVRTTYSLA